MSPQVFNRYHGNAPPGSVYVGRGTPWGNPYVINIHGDREQVCKLFESYLENRPHLVARIKRELKGKNLVCSCKPARCHGDTLLRIANEP